MKDEHNIASNPFKNIPPEVIENIREFGKSVLIAPEICDNYEHLYEQAGNSHEAAMKMIIALKSDLDSARLSIKILSNMLCSGNKIISSDCPLILKYSIGELVDKIGNAAAYLGSDDGEGHCDWFVRDLLEIDDEDLNFLYKAKGVDK